VPQSRFGVGGFNPGSFDAIAFAALPEEIRLRLLKRAIDRFGHEGPADLGKVEALLAALDRAVAERSAKRQPRRGQPGLDRPKLRRTLAGALVSLIRDRIRIEPAPPRRSRSD
ncbi:MAG: tRNA(Ile)-lysidine synthase, partial [Hyphomicrobiales bacterium]|nr:tRNA(Ile)-lysidine synthase [Hyphomicrobiales bacterium]